MISQALRQFASLALAILLTGCTDTEPKFHDSGSPLRLSAWNLFSLSDEALSPAESSLVFRPANQLFTDYAQKLRTMWIPPGAQAQLIENEIDYPVGTILSKTFYYPQDQDGNYLRQDTGTDDQVRLSNNRLLETRLLVKRKTGWTAFPYVWNDEQNEAFLRVAGASLPSSLKNDTENLRFTYFVPNENQCAGCHVTSHPDGAMHPLGAVFSQLSSPLHEFDNATSQIETLRAKAWLAEGPTPQHTPSWTDGNKALDLRATAYLNIHCGHCHNPEGVADTSALILDGSPAPPLHRGVCKPPVAAGSGAGDRFFSIVPGAPERSILLFRMQSSEPDAMMPELGRSLIHREGIDLISQWIAEMPGTCQPDSN